MKTDYASHDRAYQRKRNNPDYAGWIKQDELDDDWRLSWQPLMKKAPSRSRVVFWNSGLEQVPDTPYFQETFDPQSRCVMQDGIATRYIGKSNSILQEIIQAGFKLLHAEVCPPKHSEDLADVQVIVRRI